MANRKIEMTTLRQILTQHKSGVSIKGITRNLNKSRKSIQKYLRKASESGHSAEDLLAMPDHDLWQMFENEEVVAENDRLEILRKRFPGMEKELKGVGVTVRLLWEEYRRNDPTGYGYSQYCHHFQKWRDLRDIPMHLEHKSGDKLFIDFAGKKLSYFDGLCGEMKEAEVFVAVLGGSQYAYVEACPSQQVPSVLRALENSLEFIGGVPRAVVPDNLKAAVITSSRYEPRLNESFADFCNHYMMSVIPARPRRPRDKSLVEKGVDLAYKRIYAPMRNRKFYSLDELNQAVRELLEDANAMNFQGRDYSRKDLFERQEKPLLAPLPAQRYQMRLFAWAKVQKNSYVRLGADKHYYSIPYRFIGEKVKIAYSDRSVEIYLKNHKIAFHRRDQKPGGYSSIAEHLPSHHNHYQKTWNPEYFLSRAQNCGPSAHELIAGVLESRDHPEQSYKSCMGILSLGKRFGNQRLDLACRRALNHDNAKYQTVKNILEKGLDQQTEQPVARQGNLFEGNENIRGKEYYQ